MANGNPIQVQKYLGGIDYPVSRQQLVDHAKDAGAPEEVLNALQNIPDDEYTSPTQVTEEVSNL